MRRQPEHWQIITALSSIGGERFKVNRRLFEAINVGCLGGWSVRFNPHREYDVGPDMPTYHPSEYILEHFGDEVYAEIDRDTMMVMDHGYFCIQVIAYPRTPFGCINIFHIDLSAALQILASKLHAYHFSSLGLPGEIARGMGRTEADRWAGRWPNWREAPIGGPMSDEDGPMEHNNTSE